MSEKYFKQIYEKYTEILKHIPEGIENERIEVCKSGEKSKFYSIKKIDNKTVRKFINPKNIELITRLAQARYLTNIKRTIKSQLPKLKNLQKLNLKDIGDVYSEINPVLKTYIEPIEPNWEKTLRDWIEKETIATPKKIYGEMRSKRGDIVRSKSEKIIADLLFDHNIFYKYECPLKYRGKIYYPTFTFLSKKTKEEIYWNHYGLIDDEAYRNSMIRRNKTYTKMGMIQGKNLIETYENKMYPIDRDQIDAIIVNSLIDEVR